MIIDSKSRANRSIELKHFFEHLFPTFRLEGDRTIDDRERCDCNERRPIRTTHPNPPHHKTFKVADVGWERGEVGGP